MIVALVMEMHVATVVCTGTTVDETEYSTHGVLPGAYLTAAVVCSYVTLPEASFACSGEGGWQTNR